MTSNLADGKLFHWIVFQQPWNWKENMAGLHCNSWKYCWTTLGTSKKSWKCMNYLVIMKVPTCDQVTQELIDRFWYGELPLADVCKQIIDIITIERIQSSCYVVSRTKLHHFSFKDTTVEPRNYRHSINAATWPITATSRSPGLFCPLNNIKCYLVNLQFSKRGKNKCT